METSIHVALTVYVAAIRDDRRANDGMGQQGSRFAEPDDMFGRAQSAQPELFSERDPHLWPRERYATMARARLGQVLASLRAAERNPWTDRQAGTETVLFRQMSLWLDDEERQALRDEFRQSCLRLNIPPED